MENKYLLITIAFFLQLSISSFAQEPDEEKERKMQSIDEVSIVDVKNKYQLEKVSNLLRLETPIVKIPQNIQVVTQQTLPSCLKSYVVDLG